MHALTLLVIVLVAAPLARHVPLAVLAGILLFVAWNMGEWHEFAPRCATSAATTALLMLGTFLLTVVFDLTVAVEVGLVLACVLFICRMSTLFRVELVAPQRAGAAPTGSTARCSSARSPSSSGAAGRRARAARHDGGARRACSWSRSTPRASTRCAQLHKAVLARDGVLRLAVAAARSRSR